MFSHKTRTLRYRGRRRRTKTESEQNRARKEAETRILRSFNGLRFICPFNIRTKCSPAHSQSALDLLVRGNLTQRCVPMFAPTPDQAPRTSFIMDTFQLRFSRQTQVNSGKSSHILFKCQKCLNLPDCTLCSEPLKCLQNRKGYCAFYNS